MTGPLYTTELLRLAASLRDPHDLDREDGCCEVRSPECGSRIRAGVQLDGDRRIQNVSMNVRACAFGQAAAALVERHCRGQTHDELAEAMKTLGRWLAQESEQCVSWSEAETLAAARGRRARHGAILLPFRAVLGALKAAP